MGSTITGKRALGTLVAVVLAGCAGLYVSPLAPPPYRAKVPATYERTWAALVRALARENVPLRAIARDSGVIASDDFVAPIGVYADCGRIGDDRVEGEALATFTIFVERDGSATQLQINAKMRTQAHRKGTSGTLRSAPVYPCASTGRFEANLLDAVRDLVKD